MDMLQVFLNLFFPVIGLSTLVVLWLPLTFRSMLLRFFHAVLEENVRGKIVIITGASSGIGEKTAYQYAKRGAVLVLVARREDRLRGVADKCMKMGAMDVHPIRADVSKEEDCRRFIEETVNHYGRLDHLVNNASIANSFLFEDASSTAPLKTVLDTDFWGYVYPTYYALDHLKRTKGKIIAVASIAAWFPIPRMNIYNASKAAVVNFFDTLRIELGPSIGGIIVVTPGAIESEMLMGKFLNKDGELEMREDIRDLTIGPMPVAYAEECAKAIVRGALRNKRYVKYPFWAGATTLLYRVFAPEVVDFVLSMVFLTPVPGRKDRAPLSKVLMEIPGMKLLLYPSSIRDIKQRRK